MPPPKLTSLLTPRLGRRVHGAVLLAATTLLYSTAFFGPGSPLYLTALTALVPSFAFARRHGPATAALSGAVTGAVIMAITCGWLGAYHPAARVVGMVVGAFWFSVAFAAMSAVLRTESRFSIPAAVCIWTLSELGRSQGFPAFPYAALPYALADSEAALRIASVGGTLLVGLAVAGSNGLIYSATRHLLGGKSDRVRKAALRLAPAAAFILAITVLGSPELPETVVGTPPLTATATPASKPADGSFRVALVQPSNGSQHNVIEYEAAFRTLSSLSDEADRYDPDLAAWPETAVVPPIEWHIRHRPDRQTYDFVSSVRAYLSGRRTPTLTGNGYADPDDIHRTVEHNSAVLYSGGSMTDRYDKVMLVPFSEYLPKWIRSPSLRRWLIARFGEFWTPGAGPGILTLGPARFAAPICFEDSFGRYFASFDAPDFFIVLTNDSWAKSAAMQRQHLDMSRFRAAETGSIVLRAAETGATVAIAPNGAVAGELPPFVKGSLVVDLPLGTAMTTAYERFGKNSDIIISCIGLLLVILSFATRRRTFRIDKNGDV